MKFQDMQPGDGFGHADEISSAYEINLISSICRSYRNSLPKNFLDSKMDYE